MVKVPTTSGNVEKSYTPVMVTGVRVEADADGTESIVKKAIVHSAIAAEIILVCFIVSILLVVFFIVRAAFSFQLNLEIALGGVSAKIQPLRPCRTQVETSDDVTDLTRKPLLNECQSLFAAPVGKKLRAPQTPQSNVGNLYTLFSVPSFITILTQKLSTPPSVRNSMVSAPKILYVICTPCGFQPKLIL